MMRIVETPDFTRTAKKLHENQIRDLDKAVQFLAANPQIAQQKAGDLSHVRVYKFKMVNQLTLLAYIYEDEIITLTLLKMGPHENFYRDLKRG